MTTQASSLVACGKPEQLSALYSHLTGHETSSLERERISKRLGDVLMKEWTLVGIPLVVTAVAALAKAEEGKGLKGNLWSTKYVFSSRRRERTRDLRVIETKPS